MLLLQRPWLLLLREKLSFSLDERLKLRSVTAHPYGGSGGLAQPFLADIILAEVAPAGGPQPTSARRHRKVEIENFGVPHFSWFSRSGALPFFPAPEFLQSLFSAGGEFRGFGLGPTFRKPRKVGHPQR
jgi:hypothetical protein